MVSRYNVSHQNSVATSSLLQDLLLAFVRTIDYRTYFGLDDDISTFTQFIKEHKGLNGKKTHYASAIPLLFFELELRKRLIKLVGVNWMWFIEFNV